MRAPHGTPVRRCQGSIWNDFALSRMKTSLTGPDVAVGDVEALGESDDEESLSCAQA